MDCPDVRPIPRVRWWMFAVEAGVGLIPIPWALATYAMCARWERGRIVLFGYFFALPLIGLFSAIGVAREEHQRHKRWRVTLLLIGLGVMLGMASWLAGLMLLAPRFPTTRAPRAGASCSSRSLRIRRPPELAPRGGAFRYHAAMPAATPRTRRRSLLRAGVVVALWLAFGAVVNFGVMWWCVRGFERENSGSGPASPAGLWPERARPREHHQLAKKWTVDVPKDWPPPENGMAVEFGWLSMTLQDRVWPNGTAAWKAYADHTEAGWPLRCWWGAVRVLRVEGDGIKTERTDLSTECLDVPGMLRGPLGVSQLPIGVHPLPFIANTLFYAAVPMGVWLALGPLRRWRRRRVGRCERCGYDRAGLTAGTVCPECGHA
jgi:hypothetical protein